MDKQTFFNLIDRYQDGTATNAEKALVEEYYRRLEAMGKTELSTEDELNLREAMYRQIMSGITETQAIIIPLKRRIYRRIAAAAAILILVGFSGYFLFFNKAGNKHTEIAKSNLLEIKAPSSTNAIITLSNGEQIMLDNAANGQLTSQGNVSIKKLADGQIAYTGTNNKVIYNTLTNPRGSKVVSLTLADGSKVSLNAGSTLKYPVAFTGNSREVELTGEGYFEIAPHPRSLSMNGEGGKMPFIVSANGSTTEVLGTHFNINAYSDENGTKVTLLEGSIKLNNSVILKPGQQGQVTSNINVVDNADLAQVMAWKNGWFEFQKTDLVTIMRQISRWYDLDIVYEGKPGNEKFGGRISKDLPLSNVLHSLEANGNGVKFQLEGKKLIVQL